MAQFDVYSNADTATKKVIPYLLDVQTDLFHFISTRTVIPLALLEKVEIAVERLTPIFEIENHRLVMLTPQLVGVSHKMLRKKVTNLQTQRDKITAALDLLFLGF